MQGDIETFKTLLSHNNAILNRNLSRIMNPFGRYTVSYTPSDDPSEYLQVSTQMAISGEASLPDMLNFFTDFLRASGYVFDGELRIVSDTDPVWLSGDGMVGDFGHDVISF